MNREQKTPHKIDLNKCGVIMKEYALLSYSSDNPVVILEVEDFEENFSNGTYTNEDWTQFLEELVEYNLSDDNVVEVFVDDFESFQAEKDELDYVAVFYGAFEDYFDWDNYNFKAHTTTNIQDKLNNFKEVSADEFNAILNDSTKADLKGLYFYQVDNIWIGMDNTSNECWVEEFGSKESCISWLNGEIQFEDININHLFPNEEFRSALIRHLPYEKETTDLVQKDLESLKILKELNLEKLEIDDFTGIDQLINLEKLDVSWTLGTQLDLSNHRSLIEFYAYEGNLADINLPNPSKLKTIDVTGNDLEYLDLGEQENLVELSCNGNELTELDLDNCLNLETLQCSNNFIGSLYLDNHKELSHLECENNHLSTLEIDKERLEKMELNLECHIDGNYYSAEQLKLGVINHLFPNENFRKAILEKVFNTTNETDVYRWQLPLINLEEQLLIKGYDISDLTGLEHFENLKILDVSYNPINKLDVSNFNTLKKVVAHNCNLSTITVPNQEDTDLRTLDVRRNQLVSLDVAEQHSLKSIFASHNKLKQIELANCESLQFLTCNDNNLTGLELDDCYNLISLECEKNRIETLNVENNEELNLLSCNSNRLYKLDVSMCENLEVLQCNNNFINKLSVYELDRLTIECEDNLASREELIGKQYQGTGLTLETEVSNEDHSYVAYDMEL